MKSKEKTHKGKWFLSLAALGVVFGDIGTSPLYAVKLIFHSRLNIPLTEANILGGVSTIFWALILIVTIKYVTLIMRLDNRGEGGIMALMTLAMDATEGRKNLQWFVVTAGILGAALFFGDAIITPAISVLSAIEGLEVGSQTHQSLVVPISIGVLICLFSVQRYGTSTVGTLFGPITALWFLTLLVSGVSSIINNPQILHAINPEHALRFLTSHGFSSFLVLGAVLLVFTGAEALYTDMGHFGRSPIRMAWLGLVFPALFLNYMGQGALLMSHPHAVDNPFYRMFPSWGLYPVIILATAATVIASQACITGSFSLAKQAMQLGLLPRLTLRHTSAHLEGQIFMPGVNRLLMFLVIGAVVGFGSSTNLAAAYGVSVSGAMLISTCLAAVVYRIQLKCHLLLCLSVAAFFICIDLAFFSSSLLKISHGGWFPLGLGAIACISMFTWRDGREALALQLQRQEFKLEPYLTALLKKNPIRVPGTAVFLTSRQLSTPHALIYNLKHNKVLHENLLFITVSFVNAPRVMPGNRYILSEIRENCHYLLLRYGYIEQPDIWKVLKRLRLKKELDIDPNKASYFLTRQTITPTKQEDSRMFLWRERLFAVMFRNVSSAVEYYRIPMSRVIVMGEKIRI
ncbi:potassium transporter Kup [Microbulbifer variabilis]|uniref:Probable potassium transport system protein Kup n=1 Tax=Microbulbifer variabilis TaxID=266805 RepID=A0ABY4VB56_9GAMM|nr:potassium transporter Kup [Microbulbifer variabilis]USD19652.1 potassium transporter Kup [Microbulbifer variabilis]